SCVTVVQTCALPISRGWSREEFSLGARVHSCRCDGGRYLPLHLCLARGAASPGVLVNWAWLGGGADGGHTLAGRRGPVATDKWLGRSSPCTTTLPCLYT